MRKNWTNLIYKKTNNIDHDNIQNNRLTNEINTSLDHILYADDTAIEFKKLQDVDKNSTHTTKMPQKRISR